MRTTLKIVAFLTCLTASSLALHAEPGADSARVDFARQILPVLSNKCFICHGPDARDKDLLRLDSQAGANRDLGGYKAIDPAAPEKSQILVRIHDADDPMPPADAEKQLSKQERALIDRWVREGGNYAKHWAFVPPKKRQLEKAGTGNLIDTFVLARLKRAGIDFAPEAERTTLARRVALVLTGLPPSPEQLAAFLADQRPDAYERLVDELLDSPRYGEHQARYWLDAVRYGDTHGLHLDNRRGIYPYRDWVVHALNQNLPLDDFITWQLAGDLLPNPTLAQRVATGFVRMNPTTAEGGALPEEFQAKNNFDRTETLGTVFLGLTLTCARCHTHKFDPIPQTEYYRLLAFFNSTAENSMDGNSYTYGPVTKAPADLAGWRNWETLEATGKDLQRQVRDQAVGIMKQARQYASERKKWTSAQWRLSKVVPKEDGTLPSDDQWQETKGLPGQQKTKLPANDKAIWVSCRLTTQAEQSLWLFFSGGAGSQVLLNGKSLAIPQDSKRIIAVPFAMNAGTHELQIKLTGTGQATPIEVRFEDPWPVLAKADNWESLDERNRLLLLGAPHGPFAGLQKQELAQRIVQRTGTARLEFTTSLVAQDLPKPRKTQVLERGEYNRPVGEPLTPGTLTVMGEFPADAPRNRLGLARWLTSREHPLVARVLINRIWQRTFGEALVRTPEDFGLQGQQPSHPLLLDGLAVELHERDWDLKSMLRLMVTSRTFRQSSKWREDVDDPENRLFSRGPSYRLDAEVLRDMALWASGLLDPHMGGEGVKPYQPSGMWLALAHPASNTKKYVRDKGSRIYRRSLYVYWKRTSPHPMMTLFDAPSREASCVRRSRTNTPLQSLGLLNETQRLEMARSLGERLMREGQDDATRLNLLFRLLASRPPTNVERTACQEFLTTMRGRYKKAEKDALALLSVGDAPRAEKLDPIEHAAWAQLAITVLASDVALLLY